MDRTATDWDSAANCRMLTDFVGDLQISECWECCSHYSGNKINQRRDPSKELYELGVWTFSWKQGDFVSLGEEGKSYWRSWSLNKAEQTLRKKWMKQLEKT